MVSLRILSVKQLLDKFFLEPLTDKKVSFEQFSFVFSVGVLTMGI